MFAHPNSAHLLVGEEEHEVTELVMTSLSGAVPGADGGIRLGLRGRKLFTWCAWDPLFLAPMLGTDARAEGSCPLSGRPVTFSVGPGGVADLGPPGASMVSCSRRGVGKNPPHAPGHRTRRARTEASFEPPPQRGPDEGPARWGRRGGLRPKPRRDPRPGAGHRHRERAWRRRRQPRARRVCRRRRSSSRPPRAIRPTGSTVNPVVH